MNHSMKKHGELLLEGMTIVAKDRAAPNKHTKSNAASGERLNAGAYRNAVG